MNISYSQHKFWRENSDTDTFFSLLSNEVDFNFCTCVCFFWFYWSAVGILLFIQLWSDFLAIFRKQTPKSSSLSVRLVYFLVWSLVFLSRTVKGSSIRYTKDVFGQDFNCCNTVSLVLFNLWLRMINETGLCLRQCKQKPSNLCTLHRRTPH